MSSLILAAVLMTSGVIEAPKAQATPPPPVNLQVLDKAMSRRAVIDVMKGFTQGLGVRCQHCHVYKGDNPDDLATFEFSNDEKAEKKTARVMMRMTTGVNAELIKGIGEPATAGLARVTCYTCHRGDKRPLTQRPQP